MVCQTLFGPLPQSGSLAREARGATAAAPNVNDILLKVNVENGPGAATSGKASPDQVLTHAARAAAKQLTMRAWPVARSIFDAPYVREANERTTSWITKQLNKWLFSHSVAARGAREGPWSGQGKAW